MSFVDVLLLVSRKSAGAGRILPFLSAMLLTEGVTSSFSVSASELALSFVARF